MSQLKINMCNLTICFIPCQIGLAIRPSMKPEHYTVKMVLHKVDNNVADIVQVICQCAAW